MADNKPDQVLPAANPKPQWLQEVEDDAVYITQKRFDDAKEEAKRAKEKADREASKGSK